MKLVHSELNYSIELEENKVIVWVIEKSSIFYEYIKQLVLQVDGKDGEFVLSEDLKELKISKNVDIILEPWTLDFASRKIQNALYESIREVAYYASYYKSTQETISRAKTYILQLEQELPYGLSYTEEIDFSQFLKSLDVKLEVEATTILEQLVLYIQLCARLLKKKILILINAKSYLSVAELKELYHTSFYEKIYLILIENSVREKIKYEKEYVIDQDMCVIYP